MRSLILALHLSVATGSAIAAADPLHDPQVHRLNALVLKALHGANVNIETVVRDYEAVAKHIDETHSDPAIRQFLIRNCVSQQIRLLVYLCLTEGDVEWVRSYPITSADSQLQDSMRMAESDLARYKKMRSQGEFIPDSVEALTTSLMASSLGSEPLSEGQLAGLYVHRLSLAKHILAGGHYVHPSTAPGSIRSLVQRFLDAHGYQCLTSLATYIKKGGNGGRFDQPESIASLFRQANRPPVGLWIGLVVCAATILLACFCLVRRMMARPEIKT